MFQNLNITIIVRRVVYMYLQTKNYNENEITKKYQFKIFIAKFKSINIEKH